MTAAHTNSGPSSVDRSLEEKALSSQDAHLQGPTGAKSVYRGTLVQVSGIQDGKEFSAWLCVVSALLTDFVCPPLGCPLSQATIVGACAFLSPGIFNAMNATGVSSKLQLNVQRACC